MGKYLYFILIISNIYIREREIERERPNYIEIFYALFLYISENRRNEFYPSSVRNLKIKK